MNVSTQHVSTFGAAKLINNFEIGARHAGELDPWAKNRPRAAGLAFHSLVFVGVLILFFLLYVVLISAAYFTCMFFIIMFIGTSIDHIMMAFNSIRKK